MVREKKAVCGKDARNKMKFALVGMVLMTLLGILLERIIKSFCKGCITSLIIIL